MKSAENAKRFARSLLEIGIEETLAERFLADLGNFNEVLEGNHEFSAFLLNPMYSLEERRSLLEKVGAEIESTTAVIKFMWVLVSTRSVKLLGDIVAAYTKLLDEKAGRIRAVVESPFDMDADTLGEIEGKLSGATGKEVVVSAEKREELIGGLVIRLDNLLIDGSLKTQLEQMKDKILGGVG
ncbi:MAG: ATP synthase F1 subunit delta [Proteobacteria bacterium]|nr:ATP synthase F1 subunit delta [Pseudomonadota bacterium]